MKLSSFWNSKFVIVILFLVIGFLLFRFQSVGISYRSPLIVPSLSRTGGGVMADTAESRSIGIMPPENKEFPPTDSANRFVVRDTSLSLVVTQVSEVIEKIESTAKTLGGYLVDSDVSVPEGAASGTITIRVPAEKRSQALSALKKLAVKTISENVHGTDVTDQYTDLDARLDILGKTKTKFEAILARAEKIQDLLDVQRELVSIQSQIDAVVGQQKFLTQSAKLTKITAYLSTDEFALPFTPNDSWRPEVIFKQAVRSLVAGLRSVGTLAIWVAVYVPVWLPVILLVWWMKKKRG